jgi:hypothetical protein
MMEVSGGGGAPSLPLLLLILVGLMSAVPVYFAVKKVQGGPARFVIIAVWLRFIMSAFHKFTFDPIFAGLSGNAIASIAVALTGLYLVRPRDFSLKSLLPVYGIILLTLLSAAAHHDLVSAVNSIVKHVYFIVVMIAVYRALKQNDGARFFRALLWAFAPLPVFQLLSVALGLAKASELDGSVSYIGGYYHEATFSIALATFLVIACLAGGLNRFAKWGLLVFLVAGIALANYRTTLLALFPFAVIQIMGSTITSFVRRQRVFVALTICAVAILLILQMANFSPERFKDLAIFLENPSGFIKPQAEFSFDDRRLLSGRAYIWSGYIFTWLDGSLLNHAVGFGPDSWPDWFKVYPHNTAIAYLFELGATGLLLLLLFWTTMLRLAMRARRGERWNLIFAHLAFIFMNLATMALWQIEGVIFYALICGYSLFSAVEAGALRGQSQDSFRPT